MFTFNSDNLVLGSVDVLLGGGGGGICLGYSCLSGQVSLRRTHQFLKEEDNVTNLIN